MSTRAYLTGGVGVRGHLALLLAALKGRGPEVGGGGGVYLGAAGVPV